MSKFSTDSTLSLSKGAGISKNAPFDKLRALARNLLSAYKWQIQLRKLISNQNSGRLSAIIFPHPKAAIQLA
jgi:hypothetical protein